MTSMCRQRHFLFWLVLIAVGCSSCKSPSTRPTVINEMQPWLSQGMKPKVALVLSGGSSKGFAHVGVIRILEQEKIPIDFIVGTSVGSLIGALYGVSKNSIELEWVSFDLRSEDIFDFTLFTPTQGFAKGERLNQFILDKIGDVHLEKLRIPLYITATDLQTGELVVFSSGPVHRAVRASASIPVLFPPVAIGSRLFVDGGVVNNIPADIARQKGADIVIAVDISGTVATGTLANIKDYTMQSISIMMAVNSRAKFRYADVVIHPKINEVGIWDFTKKKELMLSGIEAAQESLPEIRESFKKWHQDHPMKN